MHIPALDCSKMEYFKNVEAWYYTSLYISKQVTMRSNKGLDLAFRTSIVSSAVGFLIHEYY